MNTIDCLRSATLGLALLGASAAHAGAVGLSYDPLFGGTQTQLAYKGTVSFNVADSCVGSAPGLVLVPLSSCGGSITANASLTLFDTAAPGNSTTAYFTLSVNSLRVFNGYVIGFDTGSSATLTDFYGTYYAGNRDYQVLAITSALPTLVSAARCGPASTCYTDLQVANRESFEGYVIARNDAGSSPLGTDAQGNPINWLVTFNNGQLNGAPTTAVPEPASLALWLGGAAALGWRLRRRSRA